MSLINKFTPVWSIFAIAVCLRLVFMEQLGSCYIFGKDEISYLADLDKLQSASWNMASYTGFDGNYPFLLKIIYSPALIFSWLGIENLLSLRLNAIFYYTVSGIILWRIQSRLNLPIWFRKILITIYLFFPSVFVWSSLGLRESWIILGFSMMILAIGNHENRYFRIFLFLLGSLLLLSLKQYLFLQFLTAFLGTVFLIKFFPKVSGRRMIFFNGLFLPVIVALTGSLIPLQFSYVEPPSSSTKSSTNVAAAVCIENGSGGIFRPLISRMSKMDMSEINQLDSKYATHATDLYLFDSDFRPPENTLLRPILTLPESLGIFLFSPFLSDNYNSRFLEIAAWEVIGWAVLYLLFLFSLISFVRSRQRASQLALVAIGFLGVFISMSALIEINIGTIFRHRSIILFPLILLIGEFYSRKSPKIKS
jgi:hypothetical protein